MGFQLYQPIRKPALRPGHIRAPQLAGTRTAGHERPSTQGRCCFNYDPACVTNSSPEKTTEPPPTDHRVRFFRFPRDVHRNEKFRLHQRGRRRRGAVAPLNHYKSTNQTGSSLTATCLLVLVGGHPSLSLRETDTQPWHIIRSHSLLGFRPRRHISHQVINAGEHVIAAIIRRNVYTGRRRGKGQKRRRTTFEF